MPEVIKAPNKLIDTKKKKKPLSTPIQSSLV